MGSALFIVGAAAIGLLVLDRSFNPGLPIGLIHNPLFWFAYVALLALSTMVRFVRQQTVLVIERLGRYNRTLSGGVNFVWPVVERVAYTFDLREQVIDVPEQDAITKDNATVTIDGILYYKIVNAKDAAYGAQDIRRAIINLAQTSMRSAIGSMELDKTFENRSEINERVVRAVSDAAQLWGAHVTRYEIKDIAMPELLRQSMERQMKAERDKRAAVLESEGVKQSEINRAEGEKQAAILRAEGHRTGAHANHPAGRRSGCTARSGEIRHRAIWPPRQGRQFAGADGRRRRSRRLARQGHGRAEDCERSRRGEPRAAGAPRPALARNGVSEWSRRSFTIPQI